MLLFWIFWLICLHSDQCNNNYILSFWQDSNLCFKSQRIIITILSGFGILSQAPVKTHLLPSQLVKTEESSVCESHAAF